jgi:NAD(P)-dependent dehydrogenase (short-subunit alcohol dehydrogenase family)
MKTAIVSGASRGIGRAIALRFARDGVRVVLCSRNQAALEAVRGEIVGLGGGASVFPADLRLADAPWRLVAFAMEQFGRIDIVVNNAGATQRGDFLELTDEDWADGYALKLFGAVRLTRSAWPHLVASGGSLVNIAGIGGRTPGAEFTIGGSVNSALQSFTKAMAEVGLRDGVQVNLVNPGTIRTERFTKRVTSSAAEQQFIAAQKVTKIGEPEDVANLVAYITGPEGRFLQGALIDLDGGATKSI